MTCSVRKQAGERLDYVRSYADWLADGDSIIAADTPVVSDIDAEPVIDDKVVRLLLSGGVAGASYKVNLKVTTRHGKSKTDTIKVRVR